MMLCMLLRQQYLLQDLLALLMEGQAHDKCLAVLRVIKPQPLPGLVLQSKLICTILPRTAAEQGQVSSCIPLLISQNDSVSKHQR